MRKTVFEGMEFWSKDYRRSWLRRVLFRVRVGIEI